MANIYPSADALIGHTPILELHHIEQAEHLSARILAKLEYFNPAGSVKDRVARAILDTAEQNGQLKPGSTIIEATSGNTCLGCRRPRISHYHRNAGNHVCRTPPAYEGVWG